MKLKYFTNTRTLMAALTACIFTVGLLPPPAAAETVAELGVVSSRYTYNIGKGAKLTDSVLNLNSGVREDEHYIEISTGTGLTGMVTDKGGPRYNNIATVPDVAAALESQGLDVIAGINGDFFHTANGIPQGVHVTDGVVRSLGSASLPAIGFYNSGGAYVGNPQFNVSLKFKENSTEYSVVIDKINHTRDNTGVFLYTKDFYETTRTTLKGTMVVLNVEDELTIGKPITGTIEKIIKDTTEAYPLSAGKMVLTATNDGPLSRLSKLKEGMDITLNISSNDGRWYQSSYIIGAYQKLVTGGNVVNSTDTTKAPRTAVGTKIDGTAVFYVVDGRSGSSSGMTLNELAARMKSLGCTEAVNLDGGGSTTLMAKYPGKDSLEMINKPSDGKPREVANQIFFVNKQARSSEPGVLHVYQPNATMLVGASSMFSVLATDSNYHYTPLYGDVAWSTDNPSGSVAGGLFTALSPGTVSVTASQGTAKGSASVKVVNKIDALNITDESTGKNIASISTAPGAVVALSANAIVDGETAISQDNCFVWAVTNNIGTIDNDGNLYVNSSMGSKGTVFVAYGDKVAMLTVETGKTPLLIEDFENDTSIFGTAEGIVLTRQSELVATGRFAGKISYNFEALNLGAASLVLPVSIKTTEPYVGLWLRGDGSGNSFVVFMNDASGNTLTREISLAGIDGFSYYELQLPAGIVAITGFGVMRSAYGLPSGDVYIDRIISSPSALIDSAPPILEFLMENSSGTNTLVLTASAKTALGGPLNAEDIVVYWDGESKHFTYDMSKCQLSVTVANPTLGSHILTVEATDAKGYKTRMSRLVERGSAAESVFYDTRNHWARGFVDFLYERDIINYSEVFGLKYFDPDAPLSRMEFSQWFTSSLRVDLDDYENVELPFEDVADIPEEYLPAAKAMYSLGLIKGELSDGKLYFRPEDPLTRATVFTIAGRYMAKGYAGVALPFEDSATVPSYALEYFELFYGMGILAGSNNKANPYQVIKRSEAAKIMFYLY